MEHGFKNIDNIQVKKAGSLESNTIYFYKRVENANLNDNKVMSTNVSSTEKDFESTWKRSLDQVWSGNTNELQAFYEQHTVIVDEQIGRAHV